jgi:hypothetical protein
MHPDKAKKAIQKAAREIAKKHGIIIKSRPQKMAKNHKTKTEKHGSLKP